MASTRESSRPIWWTRRPIFMTARCASSSSHGCAPSARSRTPKSWQRRLRRTWQRCAPLHLPPGTNLGAVRRELIPCGGNVRYLTAAWLPRERTLLQQPNANSRSLCGRRLRRVRGGPAHRRRCGVRRARLGRPGHRLPRRASVRAGVGRRCANICAGRSSDALGKSKPGVARRPSVASEEGGTAWVLNPSQPAVACRRGRHRATPPSSSASTSRRSTSSATCRNSSSKMSSRSFA